MLSRPEIGTMEHVRVWLNAKDESEPFEWLSADCPAGRYAKEFGVPVRSAEMDRLNDLAHVWPHTWGALAARA
jgi:hypothetical protein